MSLNLDDLAKLSRCRIVKSDQIGPRKYKRVSTDTRTCRKGDLFFAIKGKNFDAHDFLQTAAGKSVGAIVAHKKWYSSLSNNEKKIYCKTTLVLVNDTVKSLGELARNYRRRFIIPFIALGGSNGKTTVKDFTAYVLSKKYKVLKTEKNYNNAIGVPLTLLNLDKTYEIGVIEVGANHFGEIEYLCGIVEPQFGLITNIGKEHLEFFGNIRGAARAEFELVNYLEENYGSFFLNIDDNYIVKRIKRAGLKTFSFGKTGAPDVKGRIVRFDGFYPIVEMVRRGLNGRKSVKTKLNAIGRQSFEAALCAAAVGFYFEVSPDKIKEALLGFSVTKNRRNEVKNKEGIFMIDDTYNSNPSSVIMALENLKIYQVKGNKHIVLADMLELGKSAQREHEEIGKVVTNMKFENLYTYGKLSYNTFKAARELKNNFYFADKETLIEFLKLKLKKNDLVLIKGSRSMKMEDVADAI
jgi:UDP-N-acetylmuramoyl-tripeptide--D-alanyl-D-alanine ligase